MDPDALVKEVELLRQQNSKLVELVIAQHSRCIAQLDTVADLASG